MMLSTIALNCGQPMPAAVCAWLDEIESCPAVLIDEDLASWTEDGYVIVRDAVSAQAAVI